MKIAGIVGIITLLVLTGIFIGGKVGVGKEESIVKLMFEYDDINTLATVNHDKLSKILPKEVMAGITIGDVSVTDWGYYEYRLYPSTVSIIEGSKRSAGGYSSIRFNINNKCISPERVFLLEIEKTFTGKIKNLKVSEVYAIEL